ncbi:unnamed protein product [Psylliodes chrysocephalus]|uniref:Cyclic nucleotide-binding domain-containing protein n=1 Tax=Psylliodes chrysocephalus TaxID=3402493 RepID=A0A9P0D241_9CUCU|nr:unnamed protein product [Psylliodes chrysocephala]
MSPKHVCKLENEPVKSFLPPLHPAGKCHQKFQRKLRLLLTLNDKDLRCKTFFRTTSSLRNEQRRHGKSPYWFVIHPFSKMNVFIERLFLILFIERWLFFVAIYDRPYSIVVLHYIRDFFHALVMAAFFITGYIESKINKIIISPKKIAMRYLKTYFFIDFYVLLEDNCDVVVENIVIWLQKNVSWAPETSVPFVIPLSVLSIVCYIIRMRSILKIIKFNAASLGLGKLSTFILTQSTMVIFVLHFYTFQFYHIPWQIYFHNNYIPEDSWIVKRNITSVEYTFESYTEGFLIVLSYFLGSSYSDIITQPNEQLLLFIFCFTGRLYVLVIIGKILVYFGIGDTGESQYECLFLQLDNYMKSMDVPLHLQTQIIERFKFNYQKKYFNVQELMATLTDYLKTELFMHGAKKLIALNGFLKHLGSIELGLLFAHMTSETYAKEEIIVGELRERTHTYFILSGSVSAIGSDGVELFHLQDGDEFGLLNLSKLASYESYYSFCFVAIETTEVYSLEKKWIQMVLDRIPKLGKYFNQRAEERMAKIKLAYKTEEIGGEIVLDNMMKGRILERRRLKNIVLEY